MGDVSAEGTLVWLRRPNGTWWPSIVISPLDVPDGCPAPPRCPAVPIMLLGRRDGATYVDWCNLGRCKRVKPFRCGDLDLDHRITKAQALAASRLRNKGRYARIEDAILQALEIERARASPSPNKKRKTPNDSEDDAPPKGSRRMRDLADLSTARPPDLADALTSHLPTVVVNQAKRSKHTHATAAKRKHPTADLDQPCAASRKKDRSRPLSELCNGFASTNGQTADAHLTGLLGAASTSSSGTSTLELDPSLDTKTCSPHSRASKTDRPKLTQLSSINGILSRHDSHHFDDLGPLAATSILESGHWPTSQPCVSPKYPIWKHPEQTTDCSKADLSSQCECDNFKMKTVGSAHQEGSNRTRKNALGHKHQKTKEVHQKAPRNEVVLLEKKSDNPREPGDNMHLPVFPADLDCVGAVQQQHSERNHNLGESSGTISNSSYCENGSVSSLVFELPLQMLPPPNRAPNLERCHAIKPIKTLQLNSTLYDVELSARGISNNGRRVPLVSLMSKWNHKPVVGYPISVEVSDDVFQCLLSNTGDCQLAPSIVHGLLKKGKAVGLPPSHACRAKPKGRKKTSGKEADKLWQPHTKKPASSSPRKMRRISSFASRSSERDGGAGKLVVGKISGPTIACIPLRIVFSRIKEALSYPAK